MAMSFGFEAVVVAVSVVVTALMFFDRFRRNVLRWLTHCVPRPHASTYRRVLEAGSLGPIVFVHWWQWFNRCWAIRHASTEPSLNDLNSLPRKPSTYRGIHGASYARSTTVALA